MKIFIVGIGMEGKSTLTSEACEAIRQSEILIGAERMTLPFTDLKKPVYNSFSTDDIFKILSGTQYGTAAVLMSGDCGFFSGAKKLAEKLSEYDVSIISGISTPVYFLNKLGKSWERCKFISLHGREANIAVNVLQNEQCFFLLGGKHTAGNICRILTDYGLGKCKVWTGCDLGYPTEKIISGRADEINCEEITRLSVVYTENETPQKYIPGGIDDESFIREKIPMTKAEVRAIAVSKLEIARDEICWDIGCGTGSVSVEMALRCSSGRVISFDQKEEAVELTKKNCQKFSCDNVSVIHCGLPELPDNTELPVPDKVFIGGSGGKLKDIIALVFEKNPKAKLVIAAVTLETLNSAVSTLEENGAEPDIVQIAVTRTKKAGSSTMLTALNPVFIIKGQRK